MEQQDFQDWLEKNQSLRCFFSFAGLQKNKLNGNYQVFLNPLTSLINNLEKRSHKIVELMMSKSQESSMKTINFPIGDNLSLKRKLKFVSYKIRQFEVKSLSITLNEILNRVDAAKKLVKLFTSYPSIIPKNIVIEIPGSFFSVSHQRSCQKININLQRLNSYWEYNLDLLENTKPPLWISDFSRYFDQAVVKSMKLFDSTLSFSVCIPEETFISRAIFSSQKQLLEKIDKIVESIDTISNTNFVNQVFDLCYNIIPNSQSKSSSELSVSLMVFYRIVFDRLYEKHPNFLFLDLDSNFEYISKISLKSVKQFRFPDNFPVDQEAIMRDFVQSVEVLGNGAIDLNVSSFVTNPVDALFYVHKALTCVYEFLHLFQNGDSRNQFLSFDNVFSIFVAIYLASDVPNVFSLQYFIDTFAPKLISHPLEYASSAVSALVLHLKELIKESKEEENKF